MIGAHSSCFCLQERPAFVLRHILAPLSFFLFAFRVWLAIHQAALKEAKAQIKPLEAQVALELEQAALLASLPEDQGKMDKIIRYEASLDRQLYKAINQLERLQRRRKGEDLPAPVVLDET